MPEEKIRFRKVRDFGENFNDTFLFIRQNFKPLLSCFFAICGVFLLGEAIFSGLYQSRSFGIFDQLRRQIRVGQTDFGNIFSPEYFLTILFSMLAFVAMKVVLASYIKYYTNNGNSQPTIQEVWQIFKKYFLKVFFYSIPILLLILIGCFFCLLPGIYLAIVFVPFDIVLVMEEGSFGNAFSRCFSLIRENFWISFAIYFVALLI